MIKMNARTLSLIALIAIVFVGGVLFATAGANLLGSGDRIGTDTQATPLPFGSAPLVDSNLEWEEAFIQVAAAVNPAVVQIRSAQQIEVEPNSNPLRGSPLERFFNVPESQEPQNRTGLGSGVIIREDGFIVTNHHVVAGADKLQVTLYGGRTETAEVVGTDPNSDLAVIRIDASGLPTVPLASPGDVRVGQWVMAFGSPLSEALDNTVTSGIVSAVGRTSVGLNNLNPYSDLIQTDAAINRGNSGGPLVNLRGALVGINSMIYSTGNILGIGGVNIGIGFAIPVHIVQNVVSQLIETGRVERGFLGIGFEKVSQTLSAVLDVPPGSAQVTSVVPGSAAAKAGILEGDIIAEIDGEELTDYLRLRTIIGNKLPDDTVRLVVIRDSESIDYAIRLGRLADNFADASRDDEARTQRRNELENLGLAIRSADVEDLQEQFGVAPERAGVLIESVSDGSVAAEDAELRPFDVIVEANGESVTSVRELERVYDQVDDGEALLVRVLRFQRSQNEDGSFVTVLTALQKPE